MEKLNLSSLFILSIIVCVAVGDKCKQYKDLINLKIRLQCRDHVEISDNLLRIKERRRDYYTSRQPILYYDDGYQIQLRYEFSLFSLIQSVIPQFTSHISSFIVELDLSDQNLSNIPNIISMNNLAFLNLSRNSITEAKLFNGYELNSLSEIDYSYNLINAIEATEESKHYKKLKILNMSHNHILSIPNSVFKHFENMVSLDISYNFVEFLNSLNFEGLNNLSHLNLSHNKIADISSSLLGLNKLSDLDLSFNKVSSLDNNTFENVIELKSLNLSNNEIDNIQLGAFENLTSLFSLDLSYNKLTDIDKDLFKNHVYLKSIDLSSNNIKTLPTFLFNGNTISEFSIQNNYLEGSLISGTFEGLGLVTSLDLSYQNYTAIEDLAFVGMKRLKNLILKKNAIATLGKLCFKTLSNLVTLDLSGNRIISIDFDKSDLSNLNELNFQNNYLAEFIQDSFTNLPMLEFLDISDNKISVLHPSSFIYVNKLKNFKIKNNPIGGILQDGTFYGLSSLPKLDISNTYINTVSNDSFKGMSELKVLNISHSEVSELQFNVFSNTVTIEVLDLSFNKLDKFEINCTALINLNQLFMSNNVLKRISPASLKNLPRLNTLVLSHNDLRLLEKNIFGNQRDLRYLDVSFNSALQFDMGELNVCPLLVDLNLSSIKTNINFTYISKDIIVSQLHMSSSEIKNLSTLSLGKLSHVEDLFLDHNEITNVKISDLYNLSSLRMLDLSYNNISYIQPGAFKDNIMLYTLNVSHNNLLSVNYGIFRGLNYLSVIDFSYNIINSLENERFYEVSSLTELYVDHNNIKTFDVVRFSNTNLAKLSIGDNPIPCDVLVNINNMKLELIVTAIHKDESNFENVNGITCNRKHEADVMNKDNVTDNINSKILIEIKKIMQNISKEYVKDRDRDGYSENDKSTQYINNVDEKISKSYVYLNSTIDILTNLTLNFVNEYKNTHSTIDALSNLTSNIVNENKNIYYLLNNTHSTTDVLSNLTSNFVSDSNNTNILLNKILTAMTTYKRISTFMEPKDIDRNGSNENILSLWKEIKQDLQDEIAKEKASILSEMDKKLASINTSKELSLSNAHSEKHSNVDEVSQSKSLTFVEICLGLIVTILLGFIIFKIYMKRNSFTPRQTSSTRNLPDALENSTL